jgi:aspartyl aminopeptidase
MDTRADVRCAVDRSVNDSGFKFNLVCMQISELLDYLNARLISFGKETELLPIIGQTAPTGKQSSDESTKTPSISNHHPTLLEAVSKELKVNSSEIRDFELYACDEHVFRDMNTPADISTTRNQLALVVSMTNLYSRRDSIICFPRTYPIGDLVLEFSRPSYCTIEALAGSEVQDGGNVNVAALFNHEEIGSVSTTG